SVCVARTFTGEKGVMASSPTRSLLIAPAIISRSNATATSLRIRAGLVDLILATYQRAGISEKAATLDPSKRMNEAVVKYSTVTRNRRFILRSNTKMATNEGNVTSGIMRTRKG